MSGNGGDEEERDLDLDVDWIGDEDIPQSTSNLDPRSLLAILKSEDMILYEKVMPHWRRVVTGNKDKKIRDHIKEPGGIMLKDKLSFTLGVLGMLVTEYVALSWQGMFWMWYVFVITALVILRYFMYRRDNFQYFLLDFCYFANLCCFLGIFLFPGSAMVFSMLFAMANGPLAMAMVVWRNSLVFHSLDKITSIYIHLFPIVLLLDWRREARGQDDWTARYALPNYLDDPHAGSWTYLFWYPLLAYLLWQGLYFLKTEVLDKRRLDENPELVTSLRYLSNDSRNSMHQLVRSLLLWAGVLHRGEAFDPKTAKTKVIFMASQLIFTVVTLLPVPLWYHSPTAHNLFLAFICVKVTYNGAKFYFDAFAFKYQKQIEQVKAKAKQS